MMRIFNFLFFDSADTSVVGVEVIKGLAPQKRRSKCHPLPLGMSSHLYKAYPAPGFFWWGGRGIDGFFHLIIRIERGKIFISNMHILFADQFKIGIRHVHFCNLNMSI